MDNLTHTLAGMLLAELSCQRRGLRDIPRFRRAAYAISIAANNLPDLDALYTWITVKPLGSLLHHRGHTHTLLLALPFAALVTWAILRWVERHERFRAPDRRWLFGLGVLGGACHIGMDYGNNYGVHPFWPVNNGWFYGDSIFIVEPLFWAVSLPVLAFSIRQRVVRLVLAALLLVVLALAWFVPFVPAANAAAVCVLAAVSAGVGWRASPRLRIGYGAVAVLAIALLFVASSHAAGREIRAAAARDLSGMAVRDVVLTPLPANPACWLALVVGDEGNRYAVYTATVAPWPALSTSGACPRDTSSSPTAPLEVAELQRTPTVGWERRYSTDLAELRRLAREDCRFSAFLRFARVPYLTAGLPAERVAGDLRYDRSEGLDFADLRLGPAEPCPRLVPPWSPPRGDLLGAAPSAAIE